MRQAVDVGLEFSLPFFQEKGRKGLAGSRKSCNFAVSFRHVSDVQRHDPKGQQIAPKDEKHKPIADLHTNKSG